MDSKGNEVKSEKHKKVTLSTARKDSEKSMKSHSVDSTLRPRPSISSNKENEMNDTLAPMTSPKVAKKFINNWRQACHQTKDKTKELLKKWRTLPETSQFDNEISQTSESDEGIHQATSGTAGASKSGWSEHIWTTWVKRFPSGEETADSNPPTINLSDTQRKKFAHFFMFLLDLDRDDVISLADFEAFTERLRHFADWSRNSSEYNRLTEVQRGFIEEFLLSDNEDSSSMHSYEALEKKLNKVQLSLDEYLYKWSQILDEARNFQQLPLWLKYLPKILFQVINRSGSGIISRDELSAFYSSILGLNATQVGAFIDEAYKVLTSNGDHTLKYSVYRLCFANFVLAKNPNGPGQFLFGPVAGIKSVCFPIDYKALNSAPEELEQYSPEVNSNRRSVVV